MSSSRLSFGSRVIVVLMLMGHAAIGHFNRVSISVAGAEVFIQPDSSEIKESEKLAIPPTNSTQRFSKVFTSPQMGWVYFAFLVVYTVCMLPGGWLIDRIGAGQSLVIFACGMGAFVGLTGVLGWVVSTPVQLWIGLLIIRGLAGMMSCPLHPAAAHVVADVASAGGRATANGLVTAGALLGIAFSYPVFGKLMDSVTWTWAFVICGMTMVGYGLLWHSFAVPKLPRPLAEGLDENLATKEPSGTPLKLLFRVDFWLVTLSYFAYSYYQYLFFYWMGYYFADILQVPKEMARQAQFLIALAQGAGMVMGGVGNDFACRILGVMPGRRTIMLTGMTSCAILTWYAVNLNIGTSADGVINLDDFYRVVFFIALALACEGMCESIYWTTATDIGGKFRGFAGGFLNTIGNIGGFISPILTPILAEKMGWTHAINIACVICAVGGLIWLGIHARPAAK